MSQKEVAIVGRNNTKAAVTGQEELLVKLSSIDANDSTITSILNYLALLSSQSRTHNIIRSTSTGTISKPYSFSVANVGSADGEVEGVILSPGEVINFDAGVLNNNFGTVSYDATGTTLLITYVS